MKSYTITVNGVAYNVTVEENGESNQAAVIPSPVVTKKIDSEPVVLPKSKGSVSIEAPMPGNILDIKVTEGSKVNAGDAVIILEAMKMENEIVAPHDGEIVSVNVRKGDTVEAGQVLITLN